MEMGWSCCNRVSTFKLKVFFFFLGGIFLKESSIIFLPAKVCFDSSSVYRVSTVHVHICTLMLLSHFPSYVSQAALVTPQCVHERLSGTERGQFWQRN